MKKTSLLVAMLTSSCLLVACGSQQPGMTGKAMPRYTIGTAPNPPRAMLPTVKLPASPAALPEVMADGKDAGNVTLEDRRMLDDGASGGGQLCQSQCVVQYIITDWSGRMVLDDHWALEDDSAPVDAAAKYYARGLRTGNVVEVATGVPSSRFPNVRPIVYVIRVSKK